MSNKKAFTLIEVLVAMLILATCVSGIIASFVSAKRYILHAKRKMQATNLARQKLEELYKDVRWDTWNDPTSNLSPGSHTEPAINLGGVNYTRSYVVYDLLPQYDYRKVTVNVTWNEFSPPP